MEAKEATPTISKMSQFGLHSATRVHEAGIASNRESARRGEYVPGSCTHRPSHHGSWLHLRQIVNLREHLTTVRSATGVKSNKVAVGEPAAGLLLSKDDQNFFGHKKLS